MRTGDMENYVTRLAREVSNVWWLAKDGKWRFDCARFGRYLRK